MNSKRELWKAAKQLQHKWQCAENYIPPSHITAARRNFFQTLEATKSPGVHATNSSSTVIPTASQSLQSSKFRSVRSFRIASLSYSAVIEPQTKADPDVLNPVPELNLTDRPSPEAISPEASTEPPIPEIPKPDNPNPEAISPEASTDPPTLEIPKPESQNLSNSSLKSLKDLNQGMSQRVAKGDNAGAIALFEAWKNDPENETPSALTHNFYLHAKVRAGASFEKLLKVVEGMEAGGIKPNLLTFNSLLRAAFRERDSHAAERVLKIMEESSPPVLPDADSFNLLVSSLAMSRRVGPALYHTQGMLRVGFVPSKSTYNELLLACARMRRSRDAIALLKELQAQSIAPIPSTLGELLVASTEAEDPECCLLVLQMMTQRQLSVDQGSLLYALNLAARSGSAPLAEQAWALLSTLLGSQQPLPTFHLARIHAYAAAADFTSAVRCVRELEECGGGEGGSTAEIFCPITSLQPLTLALSRSVGVLDNAYYKLADMQSSGEVVPLAAINCVVAGCSSVRDVERSQLTFDEIQNMFKLEPNVHSYNALMDGYGKTKSSSKVAQIFEAMKGSGVLPNARSFTILADAYIVNADPAKALEVVKTMVESGFSPHRDVLIHLFRRSKRSSFHDGIEYATQLVSKMGYRHVSAGEVKRRSTLLDVASSIQTYKPRPRERDNHFF